MKGNNVMSKKRKNGPVRTYVFKSDKHKELFDKGKLSFEEATTRQEKPIMYFITQYWLRVHTKNVKHFVYANYLHPETDNFMVINEGTGEVWFHRYMSLDSLWDKVLHPAWTVYLTNLH
jgi:hypothetical protein